MVMVAKATITNFKGKLLKFKKYQQDSNPTFIFDYGRKITSFNEKVIEHGEYSLTMFNSIELFNYLPKPWLSSS